MKNRWLIAASAVGIHASLGSVYAWSVFKNPFIQQFGWTQLQAGLPFGLAIFLLGMSAAVMGHVVEHRGPRYSGTLSTIFWVIGLLGAGFVTSDMITNNDTRLWLLYFFCVIAGVGLGTGYVTPVSTLMKWFPDRRGLATGLAIMGFGFGAFFGAPVMAKMIQSLGISSTFYILGLVLYPLSAFRAMSQAALNVYGAIRRDGSQKNVVDTMQTRMELYDHLGYHAFEQKLDALFASGKD
jgi:OFA family oxalate/formate antiporter-like MFS transporter